MLYSHRPHVSQVLKTLNPKDLETLNLKDETIAAAFKKLDDDQKKMKDVEDLHDDQGINGQGCQPKSFSRDEFIKHVSPNLVSNISPLEDEVSQVHVW